MSKSHLDDLFESLKTAGFNVEKRTSNDQISFDHLTVFVPSEIEDSKEYQLFIRIQNAEEVAHLIPVEHPPSIIQMVYQFPKEVDKNQILDLLRLISLINKVIPLPCFGYDQIENRCYYKYCSLYDSQDHHFLFAPILVRMIYQVLDLYMDTFEKISTGTLHLEELLSSVHKKFNY